MLEGKILLTGGGGTLGSAIIKRAREERWNCQITIFSRDALKHIKVKGQYPEIQSVIGDIRDYTTLYNAMTGKDYVLHLGAVKHIPVSEYNSIDTYEVNVAGSLNVCRAAVELRIPKVVGISTDKACHPVNAYGATKYLMEKIFQEYARMDTKTGFHLVRYGNVLESNGSVIETWKKLVAEGKTIKMTDPRMTRFWISPAQAVNYVIRALNLESGHIYVPRMSALSIGKLAEYTVGTDVEIERTPIRPGEKMHECLLTQEEGWYALPCPGHFDLSPTTAPRKPMPQNPYTSDCAPELTKEELMELLENE